MGEIYTKEFLPFPPPSSLSPSSFLSCLSFTFLSLLLSLLLLSPRRLDNKKFWSSVELQSVDFMIKKTQGHLEWAGDVKVQDKTSESTFVLFSFVVISIIMCITVQSLRCRTSRRMKLCSELTFIFMRKRILDRRQS